MDARIGRPSAVAILSVRGRRAPLGGEPPPAATERDKREPCSSTVGGGWILLRANRIY